MKISGDILPRSLSIVAASYYNHRRMLISADANAHYSANSEIWFTARRKYASRRRGPALRRADAQLIS